MTKAGDSVFLHQAIALAYENLQRGGRPFGAVVVQGGKSIATGVNEINDTHDPTAHAELSALRKASQVLKSPRLQGCTVYASGQPCPMCLAAMHMAGIEAVFYAYSNEEAAPFGLSTASVYAELAKPLVEQSMRIRHMPLRIDGLADLYRQWQQRQ